MKMAIRYTWLKISNLLKYSLLSLLFSSFLYPIFGQDSTSIQPEYYNPTDQPIDSVTVWLDQNMFKDSNDFHRIALQTLSRAYNLENDRLIAGLHADLAEWHAFRNHYSGDSAVLHSNKALGFYQKLDDTMMVAETFSNLSIDYINIDDNEKAQEVLMKAISLYEQLEDEQGIAGAYKNLASLYRNTGDSKQAIKYSKLSIELFEKVNNYYDICISLFSQMEGYKLIGEFDNAYAAADRSLAIIDAEFPGEPGLSVNTYSLRGDISIESEDYNEALKDFTKAWEIAVKAVGHEWAISYRTDIGNALHKLGRNKEALDHLLAGIKGLEKNGSENERPEPYYDLSTVYKDLGDFKNALFYQEKAAGIKDKKVDSRIANLESEVIIKYETEKKDQAIALQEVQIKQKNKIQMLTIGIASLLALLLSALFYFFRKNQKTKIALEKKNSENVLLLKEIHHRVKNNLQTISSLLSLQSNTIDDVNALNAVNESKNRVASMALIHQKLYQRENLAAIEMRDYFETIGEAIIKSFGEKAKNVDLTVDMNELELDVDTAIPIGLITNELITNSLKHAFKEQEQGRISITLDTSENNTYKLQISDNGINDSMEKTNDSGEGFGSLLVQLLTTQLGGNLEKSINQGTSTSIEFSMQEKSAA